jgi:hypothetical protein
VRGRVGGVVAVAVVAAVTLARFAPEAVRIDREARQGFGRLALAVLVVALVAAGVHAWRSGFGWPALPLLLAALVVHHTKWVLLVAVAVLVLIAVLELGPWVRRLDAAGRRIAAATVGACVLFLGSWTLLHHLWYSPYQIIDTQIYQTYGDQIAAGRVPYRDFKLEYPPGSIAVFVAPELTSQRGDFGSYGHSYEKWAAGWGVAMVLFVGIALLALRPPPLATGAALGLTSVSPLLLGNVVLSRFDLLPAALTVAVVAALLHRRDALAAVVLALAIGVKLYPAVLVPLGVAWVWRQRGRESALRWLALVAGVTAVIFVPFAIVAPGGLAHSFGTQLGRPLQLESLGAALLIAAHHVAGVAVHLHSDHGSQNLERGAADWLGPISSALQLCAIVWVAVAFARGPATRDRLVAASAAAVTGFIAFGKVFSPQYMIWLVPLVALVRGASARLVLAAALVLTQLWFPDNYWALATELRPRESWLLLARDLAVVALFLMLARDLRAQSRSMRVDRSFQTDARAERAHPEVGTASGA